MTDLLAARTQMAVSLGFHILFAVAGMAMPVLMVIAEFWYRRTKQPVYYELAQRWAKGTAILFAVGAVSGTVLSFELGLLWPTFMEHAGPIIGMPFSLEGFAFFLEAIFLGLYLYGWERLSPRAHLFSGVMVALSGLLSGVFVMAVNAWMNNPTGFSVEGGKLGQGQLLHVDVWQAFFNPGFAVQATHMVLAAYVSVAFLVLGIHGFALIKNRTSAFHRAAFNIAFAVALISMPLQLVSGDFSAKHIAREQPCKLAAAEGLFETQARAPLTLGGIPDADARALRGALEVPPLLSVLAFGDPDAVVKGLDACPRSEWPPLAPVHFAFQIMVGAGFAMLGYIALGAYYYWRRRLSWPAPVLCRLAPWVAPLGVIALEAGWVVTEVGRQPWIIRGHMKTAEALSSLPNLVVPLIIVTVLYLFLGVVVIALLRAHVLSAPKSSSEQPGDHS